MNHSKPALLAIGAFGLLAALTLSGCGGDSKRASFTINQPTGSTSGSIETRIANGFVQDQTASPQLVSLLITDAVSGQQSLCSGTVIAPERVLSSAHCFAGTIKEVQVQTKDAAFLASKIAIAPGYFPDAALNAIFNDAAVVTVPGMLLPALPIISSVPVTEKAGLLVLGFGLDEAGEYGILKAGATTATIVTPNHIFGEQFNGGNVNPCAGDSGGPAAMTATLPSGESLVGLVGVISSGTVADCATGDVTLYTNIQGKPLLDFISAEAPGVVIR